MASLTLVPHNEFNHDIKVKAFAIYNEFLQPNSTMTLAKASQELLKILPDISTHSEKAENEAWFFADMSLQLGEQIHYSDPAQLKLIRLFQRMRQDSKPEPWTTPTQGKPSDPLFRFGEILRERQSAQVSGKEEDEALANFTSFTAKYNAYLHATDDVNIRWAVFTLQETFEARDRPLGLKSPAERDILVLASAQYILSTGQDLALRMTCETVLHSNDKCRLTLDLERWKLWRNGFMARAEDIHAREEVRNMAGKAARLMDVLLEVTPGLSNKSSEELATE